MEVRTRVTTDTAKIAIFDPDLLKHRLDDDADWWTLPKDEFEEMNKGNLLVASLGADGSYTLHVHDGELESKRRSVSVTGRLLSSSGRLFIGPAEEITGGEVEPETDTGGIFASVTPGTYAVAISIVDDGEIEVGLEPTHEPATNSFTASLKLY